METILITGAGPHGVTGSRIKDILRDKFHILSPSRKELDLTDSTKVGNYFEKNKIDYVIHSALIAPSRGHDNDDMSKEVENNLRMYYNLISHSKDFKKMFYFGSGAEFDKSLPIIEFKESDYNTRMPKDKYGFVKYVSNIHAIKSDNIYNLRIFGTINPYEPIERNVISLICAKVACGLEIDLKSNCRFSFIDIDDIARFIIYAINNKLTYHDYNMIGASCEILEIAQLIRSFMFPKLGITFRSKDIGKEYTGDKTRLESEKFVTTDLPISLKKVFDYVSEDKLDPNYIKSL